MFSFSTQRDVWMFLLPAAVFLFYLAAWFWIGPEPASGPIVARYDPPEALSAAAVRFVSTGLSDGRSLAAVIAQLAVQGCIRVEPANGKYKLSRLMSDRATEAALAREEKRVLAALFEDGPVIELSPAMDQRNTAQNSRYIFHIHDELKKQLGGKYLTRHSGVTALAVFATFVSALSLAATARGRDTFGVILFTLWILFCGFIVGLMVELSFAAAWKSTVRIGMGWVKLLPGTAAIAAFAAVIVALLTKLAAGVSPSFAFTLAAFLAVNLGFAPLLKRKTVLGRQTCDQIAGFRLFLEKVERERLDRLNPAKEAPQELDRYLPFAIALEVKEAWGDRLAEAFLIAAVAEG